MWKIWQSVSVILVVNEPNKKGKKTQTHTNSNKGTHHAQKSNIEGRNGEKKASTKLHTHRKTSREKERNANTIIRVTISTLMLINKFHAKRTVCE